MLYRRHYPSAVVFYLSDEEIDGGHIFRHFSLSATGHGRHTYSSYCAYRVSKPLAPGNCAVAHIFPIRAYFWNDQLFEAVRKLTACRLGALRRPAAAHRCKLPMRRARRSLYCPFACFPMGTLGCPVFALSFEVLAGYMSPGALSKPL